MRCAVAFLLAPDSSFTVVVRFGAEDGLRSVDALTFEDENDFISTIVLAEMDQDTTCTLVSYVLLAAVDRLRANTWLDMELEERHFLRLGFRRKSEVFRAPASQLPS